MRQILLLAAALSIAACAGNSPPERQVAQHPSATDVANRQCLQEEPQAPTETELEAMDDDALEAFDDLFKARVIDWARACQGALARVCSFHVDLGMVLPPDLRCAPGPRVE
jgi:hypothetical protein